MMQDEFQLLREENAALREENTTLRALVAELLPLKRQVEELNAQVKQLESRLAKDSHNSHLPPSSDRFARQPRTNSLRKPSDNKPGGQPGHEGSTLYQVSTPDQIIVHAVESCVSCQQDLQSEPVLQVERRQGIIIVWSLPACCTTPSPQGMVVGVALLAGALLATIAMGWNAQGLDSNVI